MLDRRFIVLVASCILSLGGCSTGSPGGEKNKPVQKYTLTGTVMRLQNGSSNIAIIQHKEIEGWMEAMTMEFPVPSADEFAKLRAGQRITATVVVEGLNYWLEDIRVE